MSESTDSSSYFYLNSYGNRCSIIKVFIVDFNNRPLGKSCTKNLEITGESEAPSFGYEYDMEPHPNIVPFVLGTPEYDLSDAFAYVSDIVYTGKAQDKPDKYSVTFDGKELTEGVDYLVLKDSGFDSAGSHTFSAVGIGNYYGIVSYEYNVLASEYDVDFDGMITTKDATAIQFYLAGISELDISYAADVNHDGEVTVEDATSLQKLLAGIC